MCGILGIAAPAGRSPSVDDGRAIAMRELLAHRGPDGAGLWRHQNVVFAHRRLAVIDPSPAGHQPMLSPDGRSALVYNGELYNDAELRAELTARGHRFRSHSDAETVLAMLDEFGERAVERLRGMYALAYINLDAQTLLLARDPLGIKPLYYATAEAGGSGELVFASEIPAILAHPAITPRPDFITVSSYLTTIRTTLGSRTLFAGVRTLEAGAVATVDLRRDDITVKSRRWWRAGHQSIASAPARSDDPEHAWSDSPSADEPTDAVLREAVQESVRVHLRSDVPVCCLLSGGLDSTIITAHAARYSAEPLRTYASGCPDAGSVTDDLTVARTVAGLLGTQHREAPVTREAFARRWPEMVAAMGLPLSTPNEVAINAVARCVREDSRIVALSGEGADELFGGYETPLSGAVRHIASMPTGDPGAWRRSGGQFQLDAAAWIATSAKPSVVNEECLRRAERDEHLREFYSARFEEVASEADDPSPFETHLRFSREINLGGLLLRLDQATMLEGVEGRTPFADQRVAAIAAQLPMSRKFTPAEEGANGEPLIASRTKIALRTAFGGDLPSIVLARPKASFPLPFQGWLADQAPLVRDSCLAREIFTDAALAAVVHSPHKVWSVAWPMINLAMWGRRWWG